MFFRRLVADCARAASFDAIEYPTTRASKGHNLVIINLAYGLREPGRVISVSPFPNDPPKEIGE